MYMHMKVLATKPQQPGKIIQLEVPSSSPPSAVNGAVLNVSRFEKYGIWI